MRIMILWNVVLTMLLIVCFYQIASVRYGVEDLVDQMNTQGESAENQINEAFQVLTDQANDTFDQIATKIDEESARIDNLAIAVQLLASLP